MKKTVKTAIISTAVFLVSALAFVSFAGSTFAADEKPKVHDYIDYEHGGPFVKHTTGSGLSVYRYDLPEDTDDKDPSAAVDNIFFYGVWDVSGISVTDHGAVGSDKEDDFEAIQKCLDMAGGNNGLTVVKVPAGTYYISGNLLIYSDTCLWLDDDAVIVRTDQNKAMLTGGLESEAGGYDNFKNITVSGGTWDGNSSDKVASRALMKIFHGKNAVLKDCTVKNVCSRHMVGFSGIENLTVSNVTFKDQYIYTGSDKGEGSAYEQNIQNDNYKSMEALHIDYISADGKAEPGSVPLDDTVNQNVKVKGCTFDNVISGAGSHYTTEEAPRNKGIVITGNIFKNVNNTCVHICNYTDTVIKDNKILSCGEGIRTNKSTGNITNNIIKINADTVKKDDDSGSGSSFGIIVYDDSNINVTGNNIYGAVRSSIVFTGSSLGYVTGNTVKGSGEHGIYLKNSRVNVINNDVGSSGKNGILLNACQNDSEFINVTDNTVTDSGDKGILSHMSDKINITGNIVSSSSIHGIKSYQTDQNNIKNNTVTGSGKTGIIVRNCKNAVVEYNTSRFNASKDIYIYEGSTGVCAGNSPGTSGIKIEDSEGFREK